MALKSPAALTSVMPTASADSGGWNEAEVISQADAAINIIPAVTAATLATIAGNILNIN